MKKKKKTVERREGIHRRCPCCRCSCVCAVCAVIWKSCKCMCRLTRCAVPEWKRCKSRCRSTQEISCLAKMLCVSGEWCVLYTHTCACDWNEMRENHDGVDGTTAILCASPSAAARVYTVHTTFIFIGYVGGIINVSTYLLWIAYVFRWQRTVRNPSAYR